MLGRTDKRSNDPARRAEFRAAWQAEMAGEFVTLKKMRKRGPARRYFIQFSYRGEGDRYLDARGMVRYRKGVWPILFDTRDEAETALKALPIFTNAAAIPGVRPRLISASVESVAVAARPRITIKPKRKAA